MAEETSPAVSGMKFFVWEWKPRHSDDFLGSFIHFLGPFCLANPDKSRAAAVVPVR